MNCPRCLAEMQLGIVTMFRRNMMYKSMNHFVLGQKIKIALILFMAALVLLHPGSNFCIWS